MVTIHRSHLVIPSETTPSTTLSLSHCDQIKLPNHGSQLYLYTNTPSTTLHSSLFTLSTSLSKTLTHFYPFAGRLTWIQGGRFQLLCNAKGALLLEATCDHHLDFDSLGDFVPSPVFELLAPKIDYDVPLEDVPLLVVQLTRFPCGSLTLGLALCRALLDGTAVMCFLNSWARLARGESLDSSLMPLLDRSLLDSRKLNKPPRFEHPEFFPPPLLKSDVAQHTNVPPELATAILKITKGQVEILKKKACDFGDGLGPHRPYTSFEVISGHLWRCVCKVRYVATNGVQVQPTRLTTLVNCRNRLSPPLPKAYFGNATFPTVTQTCSFDDIMHMPLSYAVGKVREAIEKVSDGYVRSALDYIANLDDMNLFRDMLYNKSAGKGQFRGDPNIYVVGWTNFSFYESDFGWGKPVCMLPGTINSEGKAFLMDNASGDAFIVATCLQASQVDTFKKLFYDGIEKPSSKL
ncbi:hypothetical protein RJT34_21636 [Clitoria ternatea]|uniref:Spermidine hydroxycinnamoyl transferase n=1 Tax=Clitoria ternatea TaxID=43366 RepID=A0AAN9P686_CLITE